LCSWQHAMMAWASLATLPKSSALPPRRSIDKPFVLK
jgi:hypothetical protein